MSKSHEFLALLKAARILTPLGSTWLHKKGGEYTVLDHAIDTESGEASVCYGRTDGPGFNAQLENEILFVRRVSEWTPDRFTKLSDDA